MPLARSLRRAAWRWFSQLEALRAFLTRTRRAPRSGPRLALEQLEDYCLPAASLSGAIWNDLNGDGVRQSLELGLASRVAYLDLNQNAQFDTTTVTRTPASLAIGIAPGALGSFGGFMSSLQAENLPGTLVNLAVAMDLTNNGTTPVVVAVVSPTGLTVPNLPNLFTIRPGERFVGTFDGTSTNSVATAPRPLPPGTYAPEQSFATPLSYINGTDPNGTWGLVFFGDTSKLALTSWSLTFTTLEPNAPTDASGQYSFQGLTPGTYDVRVALSGADAQTSPASGVARTVQAIDGRDATGIDFGVKAAPDLTPVAFSVKTAATAWGQDVTVSYTVANQGDGAAGPFDVEVRLSADGSVGASGPLLGTVRIDGLAAGAATSGLISVRLPGVAPAGFGSAGSAYVGVLVDPLNAVAEADETNNGNQGGGIDLARVDGSNGVAPNTVIVSKANTQHNPSLAVDPTNPLHLVTAYLDYPTNGGFPLVGVGHSFDGGATWTNTTLPLPAGFDQAAAAPTVAFDAAGRVHISFMAERFFGALPTLANPDSSQRAFGFTANNGVFVVSSTDGGATWGPAVAVASNTYSGTSVPYETFPALAADTSPTLVSGQPNTNFGSLYLTWSRFYPPGQFPGQPNSTSGSDVMLAVSRDGGATWTTQMRIDPSTGLLRSVILDPRFKDNGTGGLGRGFVTFPSVSVGAGGEVFVGTYAGGEFAVHHSSDGGRTFTPPSYEGQTGLPFPTLGGIIIPSPSLLTFPGLPGARTLPLRPVVADPVNPGRVYAVAVNSVTARVGPQAGQAIDPGDVIFAVSNDYGQTWTSNFTILKQPPAVDRLTPAQIASYVPTLNDDNGGDPAALADDPATQVLAGQALPSIAVDGNGNVAVIWYDTRVSPLAPNNTGFANAVTVWGTVSTDGGRTFSPNFKISDAAFDTLNGRFRGGDWTPAAPTTTTSLGDQIGLAIADGKVYAAWSDTRGGFGVRQDLYFGTFSLFPTPAAPTDRFSPSGTPETATELGTIISPLDLARLVLTPGQSDRWFHLHTGANGPLTVTATAERPGDLQLEITDETGAAVDFVLTDVTDATGAVVGKRARLTAAAGNGYFVHASGNNDNALPFALSLSNLTADLGTQVQGSVAGTLDFGQDEYRLTAGVTGTMTLDLNTADPNAFQALIILTPNGFTALFDGTVTPRNPVTIPVTRGQTVLILVVGQPSAYTLGFTNTDQYSTAASTQYLPTNGDPASVAVADFDGDGVADLLVTTTDRADVVSVFLGNGDGTFQAPRQFDVGAGLRGTLTADNRQPIVLDVDNDGIRDAVVPNFRAADVSVLIGRGDGTFRPQQRTDAVTSPDFTATGDFNADGKPDLVVLQNFPQLGSVSQFSVLLGHGDGTFDPAVSYKTAFTNGAGPVIAADFTGDGKTDLIVFSKNTPLGELYRGNGDGTFTESGTFRTPENAFTVQAVDLDGDGVLDLIFGGTNSGNAYTALGNGDGTFQPAQKYLVMVAGPGDNVGVRSLALIDFDAPASPLPLTAPPVVFGVQTDYGSRALVLSAASRSGQGPAQVVVLPELVDLRGNFVGFSSTPFVVTQLKSAGNLAAGDFDGDGKSEVAVVDAGGVSVVFGFSAAPPAVPPNTTPATARELSTVTHYVTPTLSIVSGREDAYFRFTVPTEVAAGSGPQVIDVSAAFQYEAGPGLQMEVLDAGGNVLATGPRVRVVAARGAQLMVHVFGQTAGADRGSGAYTLDIDVLPQVVSAQAQAFLPGGPATSIVLTLQGDRLDPETAEDPANYVVTWFGPNGAQVIPVAALGGGQPVVYNPGANVSVSSGVTFPADVRQTITLLFANPLPAGTYQIELSPDVQTAQFVPGETAALAGGVSFAGHPVVSVTGTTVVNGVTFVATDLVNANGAPGSLSQFNAGTPFLTQLQNDLGALLDALLRELGDDPAITPAVMAQILDSVLPGLNADGSDSLLIIWLDPVSINLADSEGARTVYNEGSRSVTGGLANTFIEVGGNIELVVVAGARGTFTLNVGDVGEAARGGVAIIGGGVARPSALTDALRAGTTRFEFSIESPAVAALSTTGSAGSTGSAGAAAGASTSAAATSPVGRPPAGTATDSSTPGATASVALFLAALATPGVVAAPGATGAGAPGAGAGQAGPAGAGASVAAAAGAGAGGTGDGNAPGVQLGEVIAALVAGWASELGKATSELVDGLSAAVQTGLDRLAAMVAAAKGKAGERGAVPAAAPGAKANEGKANEGAPAGKAAPGAAPGPVVVPVVAPLPAAPAPQPKVVPAVPGAEKVGISDAAPGPGAGEPDTRQLAGIGGATVLGALLGAHLFERNRPRNRLRTREAWLDELPRADRP